MTKPLRIEYIKDLYKQITTNQFIVNQEFSLPASQIIDLNATIAHLKNNDLANELFELLIMPHIPLSFHYPLCC